MLREFQWNRIFKFGSFFFINFSFIFVKINKKSDF